MRIFICALALIIGWPIVARGGEDENPFKNVKEGDWVRFRTSGARSLKSTISCMSIRRDPRVRVVDQSKRFDVFI